MARVFSSGNYLKLDSAVVSNYPFSMACWFYVADATSSHTLLSLANGSSNDNYFQLLAAGGIGGDPLRLIARNTTAVAVDTSSGFSANTWHHACAVCTSATSRSVFLDGGSKGTHTTSSTPTPNRTGVGVLYHSFPSVVATGRICEAAFWDQSLTDDEVASLYNNGVGLSPTMVRPDALVAYWPLLQTDGDADRWGQNALTAVASPTYADHVPVIYPSGVRSVVTTASPTFQAAWARGSNVIITPGIV